MLGVQLANVSTRCSSHPQGTLSCPQRIFVVFVRLLSATENDDTSCTTRLIHWPIIPSFSQWKGMRLVHTTAWWSIWLHACFYWPRFTVLKLLYLIGTLKFLSMNCVHIIHQTPFPSLRVGSGHETTDLHVISCKFLISDMITARLFLCSTVFYYACLMFCLLV